MSQKHEEKKKMAAIAQWGRRWLKGEDIGEKNLGLLGHSIAKTKKTVKGEGTREADPKMGSRD